MPILRLVAQLGLDKTGFDAGITAADKQVARFGASLKTRMAGAFGVGAVAAFAKSVLDLGSQVKTMSDRLGVSAADVQEFALAARMADGDVTLFSQAIEKLRIASMKSGSEGGNPLAQFGITIADLQSGDAAGVLRKLSIALQDFNGSAEQTKALRSVFGKGAGGIVSMLQNLPEAENMRKLTDSEAALLDRAGDRITKLWNNLKVIAAKTFLVPESGLQRGMDAGGKPKVPIQINEFEDDIAARADQEKELSKMRKETADILEKTRISGLTDEERLNELMREKVQIQRDLLFALDDEQVARVRLREAQNLQSISAIEGRHKAERGRTVIDSNQFGSIGIFTGAASTAALPAKMEQVLAQLQRTHAALVSHGIIVKDVR